MRRPSPLQAHKTPFFSKPIIMLLLVVLSIPIGMKTWDMYVNDQEYLDKLHVRQEELSILQKEHEKLTTEVAYAESSTGKEKEYRTRFDVVKAGETLVILDGQTPTEGDVSSTSSTSSISVEETHWYDMFVFWR